MGLSGLRFRVTALGHRVSRVEGINPRVYDPGLRVSGFGSHLGLGYRV